MEALIELTLCSEQQEETASEKGQEKEGAIINVNKDESKTTDEERINDVQDGKEDFSGLAKTVATTTVATTTVKTTTPTTHRTTTESFGKTTRGLFVPDETSQPSTTKTPIKKASSTVPFFFFPTESSSTTDRESIAFFDDSRISFSDDDIRSAEGRPLPLVAATPPPPPPTQGLQTSAALFNDGQLLSAQTESAAMLITPTERRQSSSRHFDGQSTAGTDDETHTRRSSRLYFMYD